MRVILFAAILILANGCTLPLMLGHLEFNNFDKTYQFNLSKEQLKDQIVETYTYDASLLLKNLGMTLIESPVVNKRYRVNTSAWLDKRNWLQHKNDIRKSIADTTEILITKHHSRKSIRVRLIITGDEHQSALTVKNVTADRRRKFSRAGEYYREKFITKIEHKFIERLKTR